MPTIEIIFMALFGWIKDRLPTRHYASFGDTGINIKSEMMGHHASPDAIDGYYGIAWYEYFIDHITHEMYRVYCYDGVYGGKGSLPIVDLGDEDPDYYYDYYYDFYSDNSGEPEENPMMCLPPKRGRHYHASYQCDGESRRLNKMMKKRAERRAISFIIKKEAWDCLPM